MMKCGLRARKHPKNYIAPPLTKCPTPLPKTAPTIQVPLTGVKTTGKIVDFTAEIEVVQRYANNEEEPIEAVYEFPLQENASVTHFFAQIDETKIEGKLQEKNQARDTYDDAISSGHGAYLMEESEEKKNLFTVNVGNLPPGKEIIIGITYVTELAFDKEKLKFVLPAQSELNNKDEVVLFAKSASDAKSPVEFGNNCKVQLFFSNSGIKTVESPSHPIEFEFGDSMNEASVTLKADPSHQLVKDFELLVSLKTPHQTCGLVETSTVHENSRAAMFCVYPELDADKDDVNAEVIFLVDRSGSMSSESRIESVRETLQVFLRSLPESVTFNIHGFGTSFANLFPKSEPFNQKNLEKATSHVKGMGANLGGTDILTPLRKIFATKCEVGVPRQVFLLTDGQVNNTEAIITEVRKNSGTTKVFTFGMGAGADRKLVEGVASVGNGSASFIRYGDNVDSIVLKVLEKALKPALTELKLELDNKSLNVSPAYLAPRFAGESILFYTYLTEKVQAVKLKLSGKYGKKAFTFEAQAKVETARPGNLIHSLAARSFIKDLETQNSYMHEPSGQIKSKYSSDKVTKEILDLSLKHHILCKSTAFVAVEKRKEATEGSMQLRNIGFDSLLKEPKKAEVVKPTARAMSVNKPLTQNTALPSRSRSAAPSLSLFKSSSVDKKKKKKSEAAPKNRFGGLEMEKEKKQAKKMQMEESKSFLKADFSELRKKETFAVALEECEDDLCSSSSSDEEENSLNNSPRNEPVAAPSAPAPPKPTMSPAPPKPTMSPSELRNLLLLANANGSFSEQALNFVGQKISLEQIAAIPHPKEVVVTAIVVLFLEAKCQDQKATWSLIVKKARKFVGNDDIFKAVQEKFSF